MDTLQDVTGDNNLNKQMNTSGHDMFQFVAGDNDFAAAAAFGR